MRNLIINNRHILEGISHFMQFYITNQQFQDHLMQKYQEYLQELQDLEYEAKFKNK